MGASGVEKPLWTASRRGASLSSARPLPSTTEDEPLALPCRHAISRGQPDPWRKLWHERSAVALRLRHTPPRETKPFLPASCRLLAHHPSSAQCVHAPIALARLAPRLCPTPVQPSSRWSFRKPMSGIPLPTAIAASQARSLGVRRTIPSTPLTEGALLSKQRSALWQHDSPYVP